ncbi:sodium/potassium-transporting ATPase subunit alpha-like [Arctopsyche grandis]|uniref:sodium/potassium-transporting ATPase subunit alpha-like n=1 Tax=Arctopsyche grandis TaxID=121162 RepID=UPI00406D8D16
MTSTNIYRRTIKKFDVTQLDAIRIHCAQETDSNDGAVSHEFGNSNITLHRIKREVSPLKYQPVCPYERIVIWLNDNEYEYLPPYYEDGATQSDATRIHYAQEMDINWMLGTCNSHGANKPRTVEMSVDQKIRSSQISRIIQLSKEDKLTKLKREYDTDTHCGTLRNLQVIYQTDIENGLSLKAAVRILKEFQPNELKILDQPPKCKLFVSSFFESMHLLIWISVFSAFFIYRAERHQLAMPFENLYVAIVLFFAGFVSTVYLFYDTYKHYPTSKSLNNVIPKYARVVRGGKLMVILSESLIIGDLVELHTGDIVPADVQIVKSDNLRIDLSSISSEVSPRSRCVECTNYNPLESKNLAFLSCSVVEGTGRGIVIATGMETFVGRTAELTAMTKTKKSKFQKRVDAFVKLLIGTNLILGCIVYGIFLSLGMDYKNAFYHTYGLIVAIIPSGIPITLVVCLAFTMKMLSNRGCICRGTRSVRLLGSVTAICLDKTGTLTRNEMVVSSLYYYNKLLDLRNVAEKYGHQFKVLIHAICLSLDPSQLPSLATKKLVNAMDAALIDFLMKHYLDRFVRNQNTKVFEIPFNSVDKYHILVHKQVTDDRYLVVMKGAPELVLKYCSTVLTKTGEIPLNGEALINVKNSCSLLGHKGQRIVAFCDGVLPHSKYPQNYKFEEDDDFPPKILRFLGLASVKDPLRSFAKNTIMALKKAGIKIVMITGDFPLTALTLSRDCGIVSEGNKTIYDDPLSNDKVDVFDSVVKGNLASTAAVITGQHLKDMRFSTIIRVIKETEELIFARVSPQQKMIVVEACQKAGHVVAAFGNNLNDIPALKASDLGITLNDTGNKLTKDIADILLEKDDLTSLVLGVEKGRLIIENLNKVVFYSITPLAAEILPFFAHGILGLPLPLSILLAVLINTVTNIIPAVSLAFEKPESALMNGPYKQVRIAKMLFIALGHSGLIQAAAGFNTYFYTMALYGFLPYNLFFSNSFWYSEFLNDYEDWYGQEWTLMERADLEGLTQSAFFISMVIMQLGNLLSCRTRVISLFKHDIDNHATLIGSFGPGQFPCGASFRFSRLPFLTSYSKSCESFVRIKLLTNARNSIDFEVLENFIVIFEPTKLPVEGLSRNHTTLCSAEITLNYMKKKRSHITKVYYYQNLDILIEDNDTAMTMELNLIPKNAENPNTSITNPNTSTVNLNNL